MELDDYISQFTSLNTAKRMGQPAPHKAVMLLSVIDLIESGGISSLSFPLSDALESKFYHNWKRYVGGSVLYKPAPATPFWHLGSEPFWTLARLDGKPLSEIVDTPSISKLQTCNIVAAIDRELFDLLQHENARAALRTTLISRYLNYGHRDIVKFIPMVLSMMSMRMMA